MTDLGPEVDISELALEMDRSCSQESLGFWDSVTSASASLSQLLLLSTVPFPLPEAQPAGIRALNGMPPCQ